MDEIKKLLKEDTEKGKFMLEMGLNTASSNGQIKVRLYKNIALFFPLKSEDTPFDNSTFDTEYF